MHDVALPPPRPRPIPLPRTIPEEAVELHRDVWCERYDRCLGQAAERNWVSFSCRGCPLMGQAQSRPELRTGGDSPLADIGVEFTRYSRRTPETASPRLVYIELSSAPVRITEIGGGRWTLKSVRSALQHLRERGIAAPVRASQHSGSGGGEAWIRTGRRTCSRCKKTQGSSAFTRNAASMDGLQPTCRSCYVIQQRAQRRRRDRPGAPIGERNASARLTAEKVREIRRRYVAGERVSSLAKEYGVDKTTLRKAAKGETWTHV